MTSSRVICIEAELRRLGENIRRSRQSFKATQEALANMCDLHRTYVCDVERGARNVSFGSLLKLARGLGITVSELTRNVESGPVLNDTTPLAGTRARPNSTAQLVQHDVSKDSDTQKNISSTKSE
jgi:transcriptional regulator with XRE-family HTH domain